MIEPPATARYPESRIQYEERKLFGLMAEFGEPERLLAAAKRAHESGYRKMDAYSAFPIDGLAEALGREETPIPLIALLGGTLGGLGGYFMQWLAMAYLYPLNVGGRPLNSWPNFIPVTFELTILVASVFAFVSVLVLNGLPQLYHPVFNVPEFQRASRDRFFLCIEAADPNFEPGRTREFIAGLQPLKITEVDE